MPPEYPLYLVSLSGSIICNVFSILVAYKSFCNTAAGVVAFNLSQRILDFPRQRPLIHIWQSHHADQRPNLERDDLSAAKILKRGPILICVIEVAGGCRK